MSYRVHSQYGQLKYQQTRSRTDITHWWNVLFDFLSTLLVLLHCIFSHVPDLLYMFVDISVEFLLFNGRLCAVCELHNAQLYLHLASGNVYCHFTLHHPREGGGKEGRKERSEVREGGRDGGMV